jgi:glycosyltransferase involved in cell wall biosynthesis
LKNLCESLSLTGQVNFLGLVEAEDMGELYRSNDVFVMSSVHEGMSNAMLEAMASGLPIVTTRCEGVEELIVDNGIVVDVCEPEPIAQAVRRLVDDGDGYERMCVAARSRAEQFSWRTVADEYIDCYRSVL